MSLNVSNILSDSFKYPVKSGSKIWRISVLIIFSFLIFPIFIITGYCLRVISNAINKIDVIPTFEDKTDLFMEGIKLFIVQFAYTCIPILLLVLSTDLLSYSIHELFYDYPTHIFWGMDFVPVNSFLGDAFVPLAIVLFVLTIILVIFASSLAYAAIAKYVREDLIVSSFRVDEIVKEISAIGWGKFLSVVFLSLVASSAVIGVLYYIVNLTGALYSFKFLSPIIALLGLVFVIPGVILFNSRVIGLINS